MEKGNAKSRSLLTSQVFDRLGAYLTLFMKKVPRKKAADARDGVENVWVFLDPA